MDLDFAQTYTSYPTPKLLRIVANAHKYQPAAVAAAQQILDTRIITEADREALLAEYEQPARPARKREWLNQPGEGTGFTGDSIFEDDGTINAAQVKQLSLWRWLIVAALAIPVLIYLVTVLYLFNELSHTPVNSRIGLIYLVNGVGSLLLLLTGIIGIILLLRQKRWGWLLTTCFTTYALTAIFSNLILAAVQYKGGMQVFMGGIMVALMAATIYLLWQPLLRNSYAVTKKTGGILVAITAVVSLLVGAYNALQITGYHL